MFRSSALLVLRRNVSAIAPLALLLAICVHASPVFAQGPGMGPPPDHVTMDERGVDLVNGQLNFSTTEVVIGQPDQGGLAYTRMIRDGRWYHNLVGTINVSGSTYSVSMDGISDVFLLTGGAFVSQTGRGATLVQNASTGIFTYTGADGTVATFTPMPVDIAIWAANAGRLTEVRRPNGLTLTFVYQQITVQATCPPPATCPVRALRMTSVSSNTGYRILFSYKANGATTTGDIGPWLHEDTVTGFNLAVDNCASSSCSFTRTWPSVTYSVSAFAYGQTVTDQSGRVTTYGGANASNFSVTPPGAPSTVLAYTGSPITSVTQGGSTWTYAYGGTTPTRTVTTTQPGGATTVATSNLNTNRLTSFRNELNRTTSYQYDGQGRVTRITLPEGNYTQFAYDTRGNVTQTTHVAKSGSGLANIVTSAAYPATCPNPRTCNQPTSTTDERGGVTNYTYNATHGGVLTVTEPAPTTGAARPQTRITYGAQFAWYKNAAGTIVQAPTSVTLPTAISACVTGTSCNNTAAEVRTTFTYGATGVANNLLPTVVVNRNGTGTLSASTTLTYTPEGDVASVDGPLSGTADATHYRYDLARQLIGVIGPDPDGAGPLPRRAVRNTYDPRGQVTLSEQGTVTGLTNANWNAFATLQRVATAYDVQGRPTHVRVLSGSTTYALQQASYDSRGRVDCVTTRMNPSTFASPPASACTLATTGSFGQDRIVRHAYDVASQVTEVTSGHGTTGAFTQQFTYTNNGRLLTARDGDGNLSTWVYDGFDRVHRLRFPTTAGGSSSTTDYVQYGYDAASNMVSYRTRADQTFGMVYDALNRRTRRTAPGTMSNLTYTYDNLGRMTGASRSGHAQTFAWDALNRLTSQTGPLGTFGFQYDLAGRRTRITWPDAFYAQYDWSLYDEVTAVRENGAASGVGILASYAYDTRGRRTTVTRGNGVTTTYGYDPVSRPTSIAHDLAGTAQDVTFSMGWNPAWQVTSRTISNGAYAYVPANETTAYVIDGRNEIVSAGGTALTYDANRNLTDDGVRTYVYDAGNRMTRAGTTNITYSPTGAMDGFGTRRLAEVGGEHLGVFTTSTGEVYRRFVPGGSAEEAAGYYYGPAADAEARRWLLTDHQGSVIAYTDGAGAAPLINRFDEYGRPASGSNQYLQYTGQLTLSATWGVYYYRNRFYNARIGRFQQTDPILYGDGLNLYAYVGNDPVNRVDPTGTQMWCYVPQGANMGQSGPGDQLVCEDIIDVTAGVPIPIHGCIGAIIMCGDSGVTTPSGIAMVEVGSRVGSSPRPPHREPFRERSDGTMELDPEYAQRACENYRAMMRSNRDIQSVSYVGSLTGFAGWARRAIGAPIVVLSALVGGTTQLLSYAPPPPGCES